MLPFSLEQFVGVFAAYNQAVWPAQILAYVLGAIVVVAVLRPGPASNRIVSGVLGLMWLWTGMLYHGLFFSQINGVAFVFAGLFAVQGVALIYAGVIRNDLRFGVRAGPSAVLGVALILYAALLYPLIGLAVGSSWSAMPMFGVTPCPVTIFTFGLFLLTTKRMSYWLLAIPFIWSLIGGSAAILLNVPQDWLLLVSGLIAVPIIVLRDRGSRLVDAH